MCGHNFGVTKHDMGKLLKLNHKKLIALKAMISLLYAIAACMLNLYWDKGATIIMTFISNFDLVLCCNHALVQKWFFCLFLGDPCLCSQCGSFNVPLL